MLYQRSKIVHLENPLLTTVNQPFLTNNQQFLTLDQILAMVHCWPFITRLYALLTRSYPLSSHQSSECDSWLIRAARGASAAAVRVPIAAAAAQQHAWHRGLQLLTWDGWGLWVTFSWKMVVIIMVLHIMVWLYDICSIIMVEKIMVIYDDD